MDRRRGLASSLVALAIGACSQAPDKALPRTVEPPFDTRLPMKELMGHVMQYAGDGIWKRQGSVSDARGERSLFPKDAAEWDEAESASLALAEITNVLLIPGRRVEEPAWDQAVARVRTVARRAATAAEHRDEKAFFEAGGALDAACESCHVRYLPGAAPQR